MILDILRNHLELDIIEALFLELDHYSKTRTHQKTSTKSQTHLDVPHIVKLNQQREVKLKHTEQKRMISKLNRTK